MYLKSFIDYYYKQYYNYINKVKSISLYFSYILTFNEWDHIRSDILCICSESYPLEIPEK